MFWRVSGLNAASPVDSILDKESYSLEELLDEDELIQECKSLNARLTAYLQQKETVEKLVRYLVEAPPPGADPRRSFKYPFAACEVFCCEVEGVFNTLLEHEELLARLFSLLQAPRPLNCMLAGYFSRVMGSLLLRRTQDVMQYLQRHQELLLQLADHVDTTSIAEVLVRLVGADEQRAFLSTNHLQWLSDTNLLCLLLDKLQPGEPVEAQSNAAEILAALAQSQVSPLARNLADPAFLQQLVERALRPPSVDAAEAAEQQQRGGGGGDGGGAAGASARTHARVHALNVCIALVEPLPPSPADAQAAAQGLGLGGGAPAAADAAAVELHAAMRAQATRCIAASLPQLVALLEAPDASRQLPTSYGLLHPPVGLARLKAVELLAALLHSGDPDAESAVMASRGVQLSMALFLQFPFNNVLHRHVAALVTALDAGSPPLSRFLLADCGLLGWLAGAPTEVTPPPRPDDEHAAERRPLRAGYAGHITQMSNRLIQAANDGHPQLRAAMESDPAWQAYVRERLEPRNALENVYAWKCGRPAVHEPMADAEADMFQTELDFGSAEGEAFTRDVYQRYGVFSSHEEEEAEAEQPQWALELASAASAAGVGSAAGAPPAPGKLPLPGADGPQPFPVYDSSSSSSAGSSSDEEGAEGAAGRRLGSEEGEVGVAPAPLGEQLPTILLPGGGASAAGGGEVQRAPPGGDDADMADDAVMLEYDAAEQLVSLSQLSLEDKENGGQEQGGAAAAQPPGSPGGAAPTPASEPVADPAAAGQQQQHTEDREAAAASGGAASEAGPPSAGAAAELAAAVGS